MVEEGEGSIYSETTKGVARKASMSCEGKGAGKGEGAKKSKRRRGGVHS